MMLLSCAALMAGASNCDDSWKGPTMPRKPVQRVGIQHQGLCRNDENGSKVCIMQSSPAFNGQVCYDIEDSTMIKNYISDLKGRCLKWAQP